MKDEGGRLSLADWLRLAAELHDHAAILPEFNVLADDRDHPIPRQLFHEQVSRAWAHRLQRTHRGPRFAIERGLASHS
jgi:hypothetical protein